MTSSIITLPIALRDAISSLIDDAKKARDEAYPSSSDLDFSLIDNMIKQTEEDSVKSVVRKSVDNLKEAFECLWVAYQDMESAQDEMNGEDDESETYQNAESNRDHSHQEYDQAVEDMNKEINNLSDFLEYPEDYINTADAEMQDALSSSSQGEQ